MAATEHTILALDVGARRIGVAMAHVVARIPNPLKTLSMSEQVVDSIQLLMTEQGAQLLVVGLPRNLRGEDTDQTRFVRLFVEKLHAAGIITVWQDEALTSVKAQQELNQRSKPYTKSDIDALAATYILEDYLRDNPGECL